MCATATKRSSGFTCLPAGTISIDAIHGGGANAIGCPPLFPRCPHSKPIQASRQHTRNESFHGSCSLDLHIALQIYCRTNSQAEFVAWQTRPSKRTSLSKDLKRERFYKCSTRTSVHRLLQNSTAVRSPDSSTLAACPVHTFWPKQHAFTTPLKASPHHSHNQQPFRTNFITAYDSYTSRDFIPAEYCARPYWAERRGPTIMAGKPSPKYTPTNRQYSRTHGPSLSSPSLLERQLQ